MNNRRINRCYRGGRRPRRPARASGHCRCRRGQPDPVYPVGSTIGLVPPTGMVPSKAFPGFEDPDNNAAIIITALPAAAYAEMEKSAVTDVLKKQASASRSASRCNLASARAS